ncbi:MAG: hypothetical protein RL120_08730 [Gammaproteobacteria bacterium]
MKTFTYAWGIGGIILLLTYAVYRLAPMAIELGSYPLGWLHWGSLAFSVLYMAWAEGYKGFHLSFAPRVVARASYLRSNPRWDLVLLAPIFCMGFIHATPRRKLLSFGLTLMIVCFVVVARQLPQPWRGILDAGVVVGLCFGIGSICYFLYQAGQNPDSISVPAEVPVDAPSS